MTLKNLKNYFQVWLKFYLSNTLEKMILRIRIDWNDWSDVKNTWNKHEERKEETLLNNDLTITFCLLYLFTCFKMKVAKCLAR